MTILHNFFKMVDESAHGPRGGFLYKYCRVETAVKIFKSGGVALDSVKNFNDPFEGRAYPVWPTDDALRQHIRANNPPDKWEEACKKALRRKEKYPDTIPQDVVEWTHTFGVSCFSEIPDNLLMWGHYAHKHQGVCIGFRYGEVRDNFLRESETLAARLSKVEYSDDFPAWKIAADNLVEKAEQAMRVLYTKATCWEYEQEWRIAAFNAAPDKVVFPLKEAFSHVLFGAKSSPEDQVRVFSAIVAGNHDISRLTFQRARMAKREYKLELDPWRPDELPSSGVINPFSDKKED